MPFVKIAVAFDGSDYAVKALDKAIELAKLQPNAELHGLYVIATQTIVVGEAFVLAPAGMRDAADERDNETLSMLEQRLQQSGLDRYKIHQLQGRPSDAIVQYAEELKCDLIVVGNRGLSGVKELLLGSVSHDVIKHAPIPVLVVK